MLDLQNNLANDNIPHDQADHNGLETETGPIALLDTLSSGIAAIVDRVGPAVVRVEPAGKDRSGGIGSGVVISPDGHDFAHNPDKISATLETMHAFPGRLLLMFQPHGYGPIRLMMNALVDCFASGLRDEDVLIMPEPVYFGGTVDRSVGSGDIVSEIGRRGRKAFAFSDRGACGDALVRLARRGDRIVVMGARDDSLSQFAHELLRRLA